MIPGALFENLSGRGTCLSQQGRKRPYRVRIQPSIATAISKLRAITSLLMITHHIFVGVLTHLEHTIGVTPIVRVIA